MSKLNIYIKSYLKIFQCICRMERFLDLYKKLVHSFWSRNRSESVPMIPFFYCRDLTLCKSVSPLRLPCGGGTVLHKVKTLQQWGIYADVISLRFLCFPCQSWRLR